VFQVLVNSLTEHI